MAAPDREPGEPNRGIRYRSEEYKGLIGQAASERRPDEPPQDEPTTARRRPSAMVRFWLFTFRYAVPAILVLFGVVYAIVGGSQGPEAFSLFAGAGLSIFLLNVLFRIGVQGEAERDREDEARAYFDEHGVWPDEDPAEQRPT